MQEGGNQIVKNSGKERQSLWPFCKDHLSYSRFGDGHLEVGLEMTESRSSMTMGEESVAGGQEEGKLWSVETGPFISNDFVVFIEIFSFK